MSVIGSNALAGASGQGSGGDYVIEKSLRFNDGDSAYLDRTPSSAGNTTTWTFSCWVKRSEGTSANPALFSVGANSGVTGFLQITFEGDEFSTYMRHSSGTNYAYTNAKLRDYSAWYHIVVAMDTTAATEADRLKMYVNGVEQTFRLSSIPAQNQTFLVNGTAVHQIGATKNSGGTTNNFLPGNLADLYLIDGQQLEPTSFGAFDDNGVWQAARFTGSHGTNGFHLDFADGSDIGNDAAGSNNWTANNLTTTGTSSALDLLFDSPTNGDPANDTEAGGVLSGNYCTWNPLSIYNGGGTMLLEDGNLNFGDQGNASKYGSVAGTIAVNSGKWFFEVTYGSGTGVDTNSYVGIIPVELLNTYNSASYFNVDGCLALRGVHAFKKGATQSDDYASGLAIGDTISVAFDCDNGTSTWYRNGTSLGTFPHTFDTQYSWTPFASDWSNGQPVSEYILNCGQRPFSMTPPTGYKAICTANLPTPDVPDGSDYFDAKLYTGNGSTNAITGLEFSPDLVWLKSRDATQSHCLFDTVRGVNKRMLVNTADEQYTVANTLTSFDNNGFTLGSNGEANASGAGHVGWAWDAGSSNTTVSVGSLNSAVYDQSQTWSTYGTFDNNWSGSAYHWDDVFNTTLANNGDGSLYVDGTTKDTWNLSSSYAVSNTIKVYTQNPTEITINEGLSSEKVVTSDGGTSLHYYEFSFTGNVESVGVRHASGGGIYLMGIWFDGKQLVDDTETPTDVPSIASTVRANPSAGFSIVTYTGTGANATIGHGLNSKPAFAIFKNVSTSNNWGVYHESLGATNIIFLNLTSATSAHASYFQNIEPTSSISTIGADGSINTSGATMISYMFSPVQGYSAFGKYTTGGANEPFLYLGFRPRFILYRYSNTTGSWAIWDTERSPYNVADKYLLANASDAEATLAAWDIVSNGLKPQTALPAGNTLIYAAFAENPFQANGGLAR